MALVNSGPEPGWYSDGTGGNRWWDGERWWDAPPAPVPPAPVPPAPQPGRAGLSRRRAVLAGIGAVVLVGVGLGAWALTRPGGPEGTPEAVVQELVDAQLAGDCAAVEAVTTDWFFDRQGLTCGDIESTAEWLAELGAEFVVGDTKPESESRVHVAVTITSVNEDAVERTFTVVVEDGQWLVESDS